MKDASSSEEQAQAVLSALDEAIAVGTWDETNFLRVIGKNLREIRDSYVNELGLNRVNKIKTESNLANRVALRAGQQEVFVALYSSEGNNLQTWERILTNLPRQMISRPIYTDEEDVSYLIKSKENKANEAYVAIYINQKDILPISSDKMMRDKFGKPLMCLKDKSINLENIYRFVHFSGVYYYSKGRLIKNNVLDSE